MIFQNGERILFTGDSVTDMGRKHPVGEGSDEALGNNYVRILDGFFSVWYPDKKLHIMNTGISGNTSRDLLARFNTDVVALCPDWVSILIGINDVWRQFDTPVIPETHVLPEEYAKNVEQMIYAAKACSKGVFLMTPYYMEPNQNDLMRARMNEYGVICKNLATRYDCKLIDLQAAFDRYFCYRHSSYVAWDRVHPNFTGAMIIAREFLKHCEFDYAAALV